MSVKPEKALLMSRFLTDSVERLVRQRLTTHTALVEKDAGGLKPERRFEIKMALLLVHEINPWEEFFASEEALIRGLSLNTLKTRKDQARHDPKAELKKL